MSKGSRSRLPVDRVASRRRVLLVCTRLPIDFRRGDQIRARQFARALSPEFEVTLLVPEPAAGASPVSLAQVRAETGARAVETYPALPTWRLPLRLARASWRGTPWQSALFGGSGLDNRLRELVPQSDVVVLQLVRLFDAVAVCAGRPVLVDLIDALSLSTTRRSELSPWWQRPLWRLEAQRLRRAERALVEASASVAVVCDRDRRVLRAALGESLAEKVIEVRLGRSMGEGSSGDGERLERQPAVATASNRLILTGNLGYFVNDDAAKWFLKEVWHRVKAVRPELSLRLAGDRPSRSLRRLAYAAGAEIVSSPSDLREELRGAVVALAPLRAGAGVPVKVLEGWQAGTPIVVSPWAAAGTTGVPGLDFLVAEEPKEWVRAILEIIDQPEVAARLAFAGRQRLAQDYSDERAAESIRGWLRAVC